jgi:hypothetical protein
MESITSSSSNFYNTTKNKLNFWVLLFVTIGIVVFIMFYNEKSKKEHMTAGTATQMFANDAQDVYTKSGVANDATGNFNLYWNQPTRVTGTWPNRGQLLPQVVLPMVAALENNNDPNNLDITLTTNEAEKEAYNKLVNKVYKDKMDRLKKYIDNPKSNEFMQRNCGENCYVNPASCGNGHGGYRLGSDFVEASEAKPFVSLQGSVYYPDEYVGSYWIQPVPDINKPLPVIANGLPPLSASQPPQP